MESHEQRVPLTCPHYNNHKKMESPYTSHHITRSLTLAQPMLPETESPDITVNATKLLC